ncbi:MAG: 7TM diverse intracellular signaling domain-containing protein, partial [Bacteroidota bacterium]
IVIFASVAVISLLQYVSAFMQLSKILPRFYKVFNGFTLLGLACLLFSFASGTLYALVFPTVNLLSFAVVLLVLITLFYATSRGHKADPLFVIAFGFSMVSAIVFILQNVNVITANVFTVHALKFGTALEVILLSLSMTGRYRDIQREKEKAQAIALRQLEELNQLKDEQNSILEQQVAERTEEIAEKNAELEQKNKDITDSIRYAKRIQEAILPPDRLVKGQLKDCFVLYIPKDIVAGDFYWLETQGDWIIFAAADCTGHGVPGAMVSVVCHNALNRAVREFGISEPAKVLDTVSILVEETFAKSEQEVKDGMDIALCALNPATGAVQYAGAHNPLWIITTRELEGLPEPYQPEGSTHRLYEIKPDKMPIGHYHQRKPFINHRLQLQPG